MSKQLPWLRVLVEGVVIVGSILLAFGIDAWWDRYQDQRQADEYGVALVRDLESDLEVWRDQAERLVLKKESLTRVLAWARTDQTPQAGVRLLEDVWTGRLFAFGSVAIQPQRSTFDELVSTGGLQLLDPGLRGPLLDYYRGTDFHQTRLRERQTGYSSLVYQALPLNDAERAALDEAERLRAADWLLRQDIERVSLAERNRAEDHQRALVELMAEATALVGYINSAVR